MIQEQDIRKLLLTDDDIAFILNKRVLDRFYVMYASEELNKEGERDKLLQYQLIQICKAFFFPTSIYMYTPQNYEQKQMQKGASFNIEHSEKYNQEKIINQCKNHFFTQVNKFKNSHKDTFYDQLKGMGYARRLDILNKYFNIDIQRLLTILYSIILVNTKSTISFNNDMPK